MKKEEILKQLTNIFREAFKNDTLKIQLSNTANDIENWDSLSHVILISKIEEHFKIKFDLMEIIEFESIKDFSEGIKEKLNQ